jgi:hypothetical protein
MAPSSHLFHDLPPADSCSYGGDPQERGVLRPIIRGTFDVDPAPLARLLNAAVADHHDVAAAARDIADDDLDGPIHLVRLLAACHYVAQRTNGRVAGPSAIADLVQALEDSGLPAATRLARGLDPDTRNGALGWLVSLWQAPITPLYDGKTI